MIGWNLVDTAKSHYSLLKDLITDFKTTTTSLDDHPMKLAVVTPYHKESAEILLRCHESILNQTISCTHILVSDGHPLPEVDRWEARHIKLPYAHGDYGDMAKSVGAMEALVSSGD